MNLRLIGAILAHAATIAAANILTAQYGLVPVGFGLVTTAGTYAAGAALLARDLVHRYGGPWWSLLAVALGGLLSWAMSTPELALASTVAFTLAELADLLVFTPLRKRSFAGAVVASNAVGAPIDTLVFLSLAGFPITWPVVAGQLLGKLLWATLLPVLIGLGVRRATARKDGGSDPLLREPQHAPGA